MDGGAYRWTGCQFQAVLQDKLQEVVFIAATLDCSTKTGLGDGKPMPKPLQSDQHPEGLPSLQLKGQARVSRDNLAWDFHVGQRRVLSEREA